MKIVELIQIDVINVEKISNYLILGQFEMNKFFLDGEELCE